MIGHQVGKTISSRCGVTSFNVMIPFGPGQYTWTCAGRIEPMEAILPVYFGYLTADKTIRVLFSIEIIQGLLKVEGPPPVYSEARNECRIPHEQVTVEGSIAIICDKIVLHSGPLQIAEGQLPGAPVASHGSCMIYPEWIRKGVPLRPGHLPPASSASAATAANSSRKSAPGSRSSTPPIRPPASSRATCAASSRSARNCDATSVASSSRQQH